MTKFIDPMGPKLLNFNYKNDPSYLYQIKWDGVRIVTYKNNGSITLINKKLKDKTLQFPEIGILQTIKYDFVIDGEIMVVDENKNSFSKVLRRNFTNDEKKIRNLTTTIPITYAVFDVLKFGEKWLMDYPIEERQKYLTEYFPNNNLIHIVQNFDDGVKLYDKTKILNLEGMIAKKRGSKYIQGKKSYSWIKYKHTQEISPFIGGLYIEEKQVKSLAVGIPHGEDKYLYIGNVGTGLTENHKRAILKAVLNEPVLSSPFINFNGKDHIWITPKVKCHIEFMEWTEEYTMRSPVFKGIIVEE